MVFHISCIAYCLTLTVGEFVHMKEEIYSKDAL